MKCEECLLAIEEYFDGELDQQSREAISAHLDRCITCTAALQELRVEHETYAVQAPDLGLSPELWAGVHAKIAGKEVGKEIARASTSLSAWQEWLGRIVAGPRVSAWVTAGLVLIAIGLTVVVMKSVEEEGSRSASSSRNVRETISTPERGAALVDTRDKPEKPNDNRVDPKNSGTAINVTPRATAREKRKPARAVGMAYRTGTPDQLVHEAEQKYLAAIAMLSRSVGRKRSRLDAATLAQFDQVIASIDRTIAGTRKAVRQHPDDPMAVQYMLTAYARKVDALREMADH